MGSATHLEIERKYDVAPTATLASLPGTVSIVAVGPGDEKRLDAVYYDTATLDLARQGVTLRRRTGGTDAGWHLKLPAGPDQRTETHHDLGPDDEPVPAPLVASVRSLIRDRPLVPVARLRTRRVEHEMLDKDGQVLGHLCDDHVTAEGLRSGTAPVEWREWEVELADAGARLLDEVDAVLRLAGATPSRARSKLQRALGREPAENPTPPGHRPADAPDTPTAGEVLRAFLDDQVSRLLIHDRGVRSEAADAVHQMRVTARRLRSVLGTYRRVLDDEHLDSVRAELRWLGQTMGRARDAQVLRERLDAAVAAQPGELVLGPVAVRIDDELAAEYRSGHDEALVALDSQRYFRLLDALDDLVSHAAHTDRAARPAAELAPQLVARDAKRLRRAVAAVEAAPDPASHDAALHEARKRAKHLRYAAESAEPAIGARAATLAKRAKRVQEALGEHQDAVVARQKLREYAVQAHLSGENGFTFGRLHALEEQRAREAEQAFWKAWRRVPKRRVRRWLGRGT